MALHGINNITANTVDSNGNQLVGDDRIHDVIYYDASSEGWLRDYSNITNPFQDSEFVTITGTGAWSDSSTDVALSRRYLQVTRIPFEYEEDLLAAYGTLASFSTTAKGNPNYVLGDWFLPGSYNFTTPPRNVFPDNFGDDMHFAGNFGDSDTSGTFWATTSGSTNHGYFIVDLAQTRP